MSNYLDYEIIGLKKELLSLKNYKQVVSSQLKTIENSVNVSITLKESGGILRGSKTAYIKAIPESTGKPIVSHTLRISDLEKRTIFFEGGVQEDGTFLYVFNVLTSENSDDTEGTDLNYEVVLVSTSDLNLSVTYEEN